MKELKLILPTSADEQEVWGYRKEFLEQGSSLDGSGGLAEAESFAQWYSKTLANRSEQTVCPGLVPATTFLAVDAADWNDRHPPPAQRRTPALWRQHRVQRAPLLPQTGLCHTDARTGFGGVPQNADAEGAGHLQQGEHRLGKDHPEKWRCFRKRGGRKRERRGPHYPALLDYPVIRR